MLPLRYGHPPGVAPEGTVLDEFGELEKELTI